MADLSSPNTQITLEVRVPRENEAGAQSMAQIFAALPKLPGILHRLTKNVPCFFFEWLNQNQTTYALVTVPQKYKEYVESQISAHYPEVLIQPLAHNPLDQFVENSGEKFITRFGEIKTKFALEPLKSYADSPKNDLLAPTLSMLSKLGENESALIRIQVQRSARKLAATEPAKGKPFSKLALKSGQPLFAVTIHFLVQTKNKERSQQILESLESAFQSFSSPENHISLSLPWMSTLNISGTRKFLPRKRHAPKIFLSADELATLFHFPNIELQTIRGLAWGKNLHGEPPENLPTFSSLSDDEKKTTNIVAQVEFRNQKQTFGMRDEDRRRHLYVIGKSGTGKSTLLANMIINDMKQGKGVAVIDPHGDLIDTLLNYVPKFRINDTIVLDPSDPNGGVQINLFEGSSPFQRELIASGIVAIFQKLYSRSWGPRLEYVLRNTLLTLLQHEVKLSDTIRLLTDESYRENIVSKTGDPILKNFWLNEFSRLSEKQRVETISPILNKVGQFVTSPIIRRVVDTTKSTIDIEDIMNSGKILLVNVSQGKLGEDNAALLGAMIITKIQLSAMNRVSLSENERRDFHLYIDEFQNFATTSFIKILSEARKYRVSLTLANQYIDQMPEEVRTAIFGNAGNLISFVVGASDARFLQREFGNQYSEQDLTSLGRYQILLRMLINGQTTKAFPAQTLALANSKNDHRETVLRTSRERHGRK